MRNAYLINLTNTRVMGAYDNIDLAEAAGNAARFDFTVVEDAGDIESQLSHGEITTIYNDLTGRDIKGFHTKVKGAQRLAQTLEMTDWTSVAPAKEPVNNKKLRSNGAVAQVWEMADALHAKGEATRANLLAAAEAAGVNHNTAKTQWQAWRKVNLK